VFFVFHKRLLIRDLTVLPTGSHIGPSSYTFRGISNLLMSIDLYEVRLRKEHRGVDLISDALPFGRLWYGGTQSATRLGGCPVGDCPRRRFAARPVLPLG
jgi:hypothetical protein